MTLPALKSTTKTTTTLPHHPNTKQPPYTTHHQDLTRPINLNRSHCFMDLFNFPPLTQWSVAPNRHAVHSNASRRNRSQSSQCHNSSFSWTDFPSEGKAFGSLLHAYVRKLGLDTCNLMVGILFSLNLH